MTTTVRRHAGLMVEVLKRCIIPFITAAILAVFYGAYITKVKSALEINWNNVIEKVFFILTVFVIAYWLRTISVAFFNWYATSVAERTHSSIDEEFIPLFRKIVSVILWIIAVIVALSYLGINIAALITTLGVGSLAIALAAQDTFANIIAGFLIMIDRPFKVGDEIKLPSGEKVNVLWIGNRRSKFRAEDGSLVIVPNLDLSKSKIVNYSSLNP
jgi:small-conductance mechanosensitive channel